MEAFEVNRQSEAYRFRQRDGPATLNPTSWNTTNQDNHAVSSNERFLVNHEDRLCIVLISVTLFPFVLFSCKTVNKFCQVLPRLQTDDAIPAHALGCRPGCSVLEYDDVHADFCVELM